LLFSKKSWLERGNTIEHGAAFSIVRSFRLLDENSNRVTYGEKPTFIIVSRVLLLLMERVGELMR
jgi:hypothetical protein